MKKSMPMISKPDIMGNIYGGNFYVLRPVLALVQGVEISYNNLV
jgi:hypothetical protein